VIFRFGAFHLDTRVLELRQREKPVRIEPRVFDALRLLIENRGRVVSKDELIEHVWDGRIVSEATISTCINAVRRAVGDDGKRQEIIRTVPRRGFRFVQTVAVVEEESSILGGEKHVSSEIGVPSLEEKRASLQPNSHSIAVLPFDNLSNDPEQEYFSDGMAEDLITDLSKISGLFVVARNSSFAFKGQPVEVKEIGKQLGVHNILEGSVRKMGSKLRVNAQLVDAASGGHLWAERYDGHLADIFDFQDRIREEIVSALQVKLTPKDRILAERRPSSSVEAYDLFLRGRASYFRYTPEDHAAAKIYFEQAIALDPEFADAYSFLSYLYSAAWNLLYPGFEDGLERALPVAEKAVSLDPGSAIAHMRLGWTLCFMRQFDRALPCFEKAVVLGPDIAEVFSYYGMFLNYIGRPEQGLELIETAFRLDPIAPTIWELMAGYSYWELERHDDAVAQFRKVIDRLPAFPMTYMFLASVYVELGRLNDAMEQLKTLKTMNPMWSVRHADRIFPILSDDKRKLFLDNLHQAGLPD